MSKVYFVLSVMARAVKIGKSVNPLNRLQVLQVGHPGELRMLAMQDGDERLERSLHIRFVKYRITGEWFRYEGEVRSYIDSLILTPGDGIENSPQHIAREGKRVEETRSQLLEWLNVKGSSSVLDDIFGQKASREIQINTIGVIDEIRKGCDKKGLYKLLEEAIEKRKETA